MGLTQLKQQFIALDRHSRESGNLLARALMDPRIREGDRA
jgi:hypothetical protein